MRRPGAHLRKCEADAAGIISARVLAATAGHIPKVYSCMMNAGGSAVERLIFGIMAAGAAIGACVKYLSHHERSDHFWLKGALCALNHLVVGEFCRGRKWRALVCRGPISI